MEFDEGRLFAYIDEHRDEYVELLRKYVRQPSLAGTGEGIEDMVRIVIDEFRARGLDVEVCETPGNPVIVATIPGESDKVFGCYHHYDVQPVDPLNEWVDEPFSAAIHDGRIWGRGVCDDKQGLVTHLCCIDAYQHVFGKLPCGVKFIVEGEEEIGSPNLEWFATHHADKLDCDGYNWEGGNRANDKGPLDICIGVKGLLYVEMTCRGAKMDSHSCNAAVVENPAWRLIWALNSIKGPDGRILIDGFYDGVQPVSDVDRAAFAQDGFDAEALKRYLGIDHFIGNAEGDELLAKLHYEPTFNICGFYSGYIAEGSKTVLPAYAQVKCDIRLVAGQDPDRIFSLLRKHLDDNGFADIELTYDSGCFAFRSDPKSDFVQACIRAAERVSGQKVTLNYMNPGTSPMHVFCLDKNIPAAMVGCMSEEANIHAPNEWVDIDDYIDGIKVCSAIMHELGGMR